VNTTRTIAEPASSRQGPVLWNPRCCRESNPSLPVDRGDKPGESGGPSVLPPSWGRSHSEAGEWRIKRIPCRQSAPTKSAGQPKPWEASSWSRAKVDKPGRSIEWRRTASASSNTKPARPRDPVEWIGSSNQMILLAHCELMHRPSRPMLAIQCSVLQASGG